MQVKKKQANHFVVENLIKIMNDKNLNKSNFSDLIGIENAKWSKITNGYQNLNIDDLSKIAKKLRLREIDILTYPDVFEKKEKSKSTKRIMVELEVTNEEYEKLDLKNKILKQIE